MPALNPGPSWGVVNFDVARNSPFTLTLSYDGENVSDLAVSGQVRTHRDTGTLLAEFAIDDSDAATGYIVVTLTATQTAAIPGQVVVYDIYEATDGAQMTGEFHMTGSVTR